MAGTWQLTRVRMLDREGARVPAIAGSLTLADPLAYFPFIGGNAMEYCRPLNALRAADGPRFGGKSASLGELLAAGIPVPPGFALSADAFRFFVAHSEIEGEIDRRLEECQSGGVQLLNAASRAIADAFASAGIPESVAAQVSAAYAELDEPPVAVRSSAIGEDSATATFAGQQESFLWVSGPERVLAAVRNCWASLYTPRALSYRAKLGRTETAPAMGVAIQEMVDARVSGVMFTCSPASGDPSAIAVNASWGLGESVVAGEVTPDELMLSKVTGEVISETISDKAVEHIPAPEGPGTIAREVEPERRRARCLSTQDLEELVDLARRIERHFGCHQDVEWALARNGGLFVVQSRPVTFGLKDHEPKPSEPASAISLVMSAFGVKK